MNKVRRENRKKKERTKRIFVVLLHLIFVQHFDRNIQVEIREREKKKNETRKRRKKNRN